MDANVFWKDNFEKLCAFHEKHGHCNVPSDHEDELLYRFAAAKKNAVSWASKGESPEPLTPQMPQFSRNLGRVGFVWNPRDAGWMDVR